MFLYEVVGSSVSSLDLFWKETLKHQTTTPTPSGLPVAKALIHT